MDQVVRVYQELSLLPVAQQIQWDRAPFIEGAAVIGDHLGYDRWKREETARLLENIFSLAVNEGKTFEEAMDAVHRSVSNAISG